MSVTDDRGEPVHGEDDPDPAHRTCRAKFNSAYQFSLADEQDSVRIDPERLFGLAQSVLHGEQIATAEISIALVDDATIHDLNRRYLDHDWPTDVISFSLEDDDLQTPDDHRDTPSGGRIDGEIVISGETAAREARERGDSAEQEVALYLVHGLLHLCGYDDHTDVDRTRMEQRQQSYLHNFDFPERGDFSLQ